MEALENWAPAHISLLRSMPRCIGQTSNQLSLFLLPVCQYEDRHTYAASCANMLDRGQSSFPARPCASDARLA